MFGEKGYRICVNEWPKEEQRLGLTDPWRHDWAKCELIDTEIEFNGVNVLTKKVKTNPEVKSSSNEEKANYALEVNKFIIKRLIEEGCYGEALAVSVKEYDIFELNDKLAAYIESFKPCAANGQCYIWCPCYKGDCNVYNNIEAKRR